jgi:hypothetical protein
VGWKRLFRLQVAFVVLAAASLLFGGDAAGPLVIAVFVAWLAGLAVLGRIGRDR